VNEQAPTPLWRNRDFLLLWSGQTISTLGTRVTSLAYPLLVLAVTGSPAQAGLVGFAQTLPFLVWYLPAGALVDRWDRKRIMLVADAGRALALGSVVVALMADRLTLGQLLVVGFVEGSLYVFFQLAEGAALPHVVARSQLPAAVAQNQARDHGAELAGQPLGGFLFGIGHAVPFLFDAISYVVAFLALLFVRPPLQERRDEPRRHLLAEVAEGIRWLWRQRLLRLLVLLIGITNFAFNAMALALIVRAQQLGASPAAIGLAFGAMGVGAVLGAVLAPWLQRLIPAPVIMVGALWAWAVQLAALAVVPSLVAIGLILAVGGALGPLFNVVVAGYRYALAPDRLQARTISVGRLFAWGTIPLASLSAGLLLEVWDAVPTLVLMAVALVGVSIAATAAPTIRRAPQPDALTMVGVDGK
jgi:Na+/melibiose symporter-like transporter